MIFCILLFISRSHFVHDTDSLVLEDELQRIKLTGDCINVNEVVTGVVVALLGTVNVTIKIMRVMKLIFVLKHL